ncbi:hypothetical protein [Cellulomonas triticagri]|uniref:hypothetical protein n=1 Tax=Cellulomonas triticagri TaxID=2483352 RepID=UPI0011C4027E|nr:hypothetical protein [Cellulomonas triticagri]
MLLLILPMLLAATTMSIGWSTAQRAAIQASAAAEAGIAEARAVLASGDCWSRAPGGTLTSTVTPTGEPLAYEVEIRPKAAGSLTEPTTAACPTTSGALYTESVTIVATGHASTPGVGNSSGDTRTMQAVVDAQYPAPPGWVDYQGYPFSVYSERDMTRMPNSESNFNPTIDLETRILVGGDFTCGYPSATGAYGNSHTYVLGDMTVDELPSTHGDQCGPVSGGSSLVSASAMRIGGDLNLDSEFRLFRKLVWVDGSLRANHPRALSTGFSSTVIVDGDLILDNFYGVTESTSVRYVVGGDLVVNARSSRDRYTDKAIAIPSDSSLSVVVGGQLRGTWADAWQAEAEADDKFDLTVGVGKEAALSTGPVAPEFPAELLDPSLMRWRADAPHLRGGDELQDMDWDTALEAASSGTLSDSCVLSGELVFTVTTGTRIDTRTTCPTGLVFDGDVTFDLQGDLVLLIAGLTQRGSTQVVAPSDGFSALYVVEPWPDAPGATCDDNGANGIHLESGAFSHVNYEDVRKSSAVVFYTAGELRLGENFPAQLWTNSHRMIGHWYGCTVEIADRTGTGKVPYLSAPFARSSAPSTPSGQEPTWVLVSVRDT